MLNFLSLVCPLTATLRTYKGTITFSFPVTRILDACDELRDVSLPELGVKLEDVEGKYQLFLFSFSVCAHIITLVAFLPLPRGPGIQNVPSSQNQQFTELFLRWRLNFYLNNPAILNKIGSGIFNGLGVNSP